MTNFTSGDFSLPPVECGECGGTGEYETFHGERPANMGGIEPIYRSHRCEYCSEGLALCVNCGDYPSYQMPTFDRLCAKCLKESLDEDAP